MKVAGAFYVKTHLSALLEEVERGEVVEITKRGKPVARLVPVEDESAADEKRVRAQKAADYFLNLKRKQLPKGMLITDIIKAGRKY